jgi:hypothetical protein
MPCLLLLLMSLLLFPLLFAVLGIEPRASSMLDKCSTPELHLQPSTSVIFQISHKLWFCCLLFTCMILLVSSSSRPQWHYPVCHGGVDVGETLGHACMPMCVSVLVCRNASLLFHLPKCWCGKPVRKAPWSLASILLLEKHPQNTFSTCMLPE